jgi:hypothetical protein
MSSLVKNEEGLPQMVMSDFEKDVMNTLSRVFPFRRICNMVIIKIFYLDVFVPV